MLALLLNFYPGCGTTRIKLTPKFLPPNTIALNWCTIHFTYNIKPEAIKPNYIIKIYPWNKSKQEFYIDDISINYKGTEKVNSSTALQLSVTNFFYDFETTDGLTGTETIKQTTAHSGKMASDLSG